MSHQGGDSFTKRAKFDQESEFKATGESNISDRSTPGPEHHMASTSSETVASTSNAASSSSNITEKLDLDQLPNEMHEMRIRDEKTTGHYDKVILWSYSLQNVSVHVC